MLVKMEYVFFCQPETNGMQTFTLICTLTVHFIRNTSDILVAAVQCKTNKHHIQSGDQKIYH